MHRNMPALFVALSSLTIATQAEGGWGRTLHPVAAAPAVVTQHVVVPTTSYYVPATTPYYAPATTTHYAPAATTYSVPATYVAPAPIVVARPVVTTPGYVIPPPRFRIRRAAPSLYVAPSVVAP